eukprot:scaffold32611_cov19-Tisochrysis_lutea.AAC.1
MAFHLTHSWHPDENSHLGKHQLLITWFSWRIISRHGSYVTIVRAACTGRSRTGRGHADRHVRRMTTIGGFEAKLKDKHLRAKSKSPRRFSVVGEVDEEEPPAPAEENAEDRKGSQSDLKPLADSALQELWGLERGAKQQVGVLILRALQATCGSEDGVPVGIKVERLKASGVFSYTKFGGHQDVVPVRNLNEN